METNKEERTINAWLRPLSMPSIQIMPFEPPVDKIDPSWLIRDLCQDSSADVLEKIKERYLRLSTSDLDIFVVPAENVILNKIVWPLKSAKQAFCLADFIGCIALCGMVCEMVMVFIYDLVATQSNLNHLAHKDQQLFVDRKYERRGQEERIKKLRKLGFIPDSMSKDAHTVRKIRREYLHFLNKDFAKLEEDAYLAYVAAFRVVKSLVELPLGDEGRLAIPSHLKSYLESKGA